MAAIINLMKGIADGVSKNRDSIKRVGVVAIVTFLGKLIKDSTFQCPCISKDALFKQCFANVNGKALDFDDNLEKIPCVSSVNVVYGCLYLAAPAAILFMLGITSSAHLWKAAKGRCFHRSSHLTCFWTLSKLRSATFIAPVAWVALALLQGEYYACASTPLPYILGENQTCDDVNKLLKTEQYNYNLHFSQNIGWFVILALLVAAWIAFMLTRCFNPTTFYEERYNSMFRDIEETVFESALEEQVKTTMAAVAKNVARDPKLDARFWISYLKTHSMESNVNKNNLETCYKDWKAGFP